MRWLLTTCAVVSILSKGACFWDDSTTTRFERDPDDDVRTSFFRWVHVRSDKFLFFFPSWWAWDKANKLGRRLFCVAGISIDFQPITTGMILNRRSVLTAANPLDPYADRQEDIRLWALGRTGKYDTPYRYRTWRIRRLLPRSLNPEHQIGPHGRFCTRHDLSVVFSKDQIYLYGYVYDRYMYAVRKLVCQKTTTFKGLTFYVGSGFKHMEHIRQNYKIYHHEVFPEDIVNCERYLPKYWGKHVCFLRTKEENRIVAGVQNGGGLITSDGSCVIGMPAFDLRYNNERIFVFTDLRYYMTWLHIICNISAGEYYDYAYQQWGCRKDWIFDGFGVTLFIPGWSWMWGLFTNIQYDIFPLG